MAGETPRDATDEPPNEDVPPHDDENVTRDNEIATGDPDREQSPLRIEEQGLADDE